MVPGFSIVNWCAYSPGLDRSADSRFLDDDISTNVSFLPPMSRRRLSNLSKLCLRLAHETAPDYQGYCVFGSQHGEIVTTVGLIRSIVTADLVSPAGFSSSVHNTAVGLHSINNKNTYPCTSLAAGLDTLPSCFIEATSLLHSTEAKQVLVVVADDAIPEEYETYVNNNVKCGLAALVSRSNNEQNVSIEQGAEQLLAETVEPVVQLASFLAKEENGTCLLPGEISDWHWRCNVQ